MSYAAHAYACIPVLSSSLIGVHAYVGGVFAKLWCPRAFMERL